MVYKYFTHISVVWRKACLEYSCDNRNYIEKSRKALQYIYCSRLRIHTVNFNTDQN